MFGDISRVKLLFGPNQTFTRHFPGEIFVLNFYYIDIDNEDNIPNYFAIEKGRVVAEEFYRDDSVIKMFQQAGVEFVINNDNTLTVIT